jgi:hypothetical protein
MVRLYSFRCNAAFFTAQFPVYIPARFVTYVLT